MKLLDCNGKRMLVYDLGPLVYRVSMMQVPIKHNGIYICTEDQAREILNELRESGFYHCEAIKA